MCMRVWARCKSFALSGVHAVRCVFLATFVEMDSSTLLKAYNKFREIFC